MSQNEQEKNKNKQSKISCFFRKRNAENSQNTNPTDHDDGQSSDHATSASSPVESDQSTTESAPTDTSSEPAAKKKRTHVFSHQWKDSRPWLFINEKQEMLCKWCIDTGKNNSFTTGNTNFRTSTLDRHVDLPAHKQAILDLKQSDNFKTSAMNAFHQKSDAIERAMSVTYFLAQNNIASLKYSSMLDFMDFHGVNVGAMNIGKNATYTSRASVEEFQESPADVIEGDILMKVNDSPYISILTDESTDISNSKKMVVYTRIIDPVSYVASTHFLGNITVKGSSASAEVLHDHIVNFLKEKDIPLTKLVGFGSDGAAVMVGRKSGVAARLREQCPHLINIHCMAHKFNLCTSQASRNIPYLKDTFEKTFKDLYYYFDKSANRAAELKEIQKVLDGPQLKVREVHEIRWLAFYDALYAVYHSWKALVNYFTKNNKTQVCKDILDKLTDYRFVTFLHVMMDIIPHLAQLSMLLQKSDLDVASVAPALDNIYSTLKRADAKKTHYQTIMSEQLASLVDKDKQGVTFNGVTLKIHRSTVKKATEDISTIRHDFVSALTDQIKSRFPKDSTDIAAAFGVLGLRNLTFLSQEEQETHGEDQIKVLADFFGKEQKSKKVNSPPLIDHGSIIPEWTLAKTVIRREMYPRDKMALLWQIVHKHHAETFPNLDRLVAIALIMPYQTADCERGFSKQNITKTPSRNRLEGPALNRLLMISIEGPPLREFDFKKAVASWKAKKDRRLFKQ